MSRYNPPDVFRSLWDVLDRLISDTTVASVEEVLDEICIGSDDLVEWSNARKYCFITSTESVQKEVRRILSTHPRLITGNGKRNNADPFVIAMALEHGCTVVTQENRTGKDNPPNIPNVCDDYKINYCNLVKFLRDNKISI